MVHRRGNGFYSKGGRENGCTWQEFVNMGLNGMDNAVMAIKNGSTTDEGGVYVDLNGFLGLCGRTFVVFSLDCFDSHVLFCFTATLLF
jgi:hypothetical protein